MVFLIAVHLSPDSLIGRPLATSKLCQVGRSSSPSPLAAARDAGPRVYMPSHEAIRSFQHAAGMQKSLHVGTGRVPPVNVPLPRC